LCLGQDGAADAEQLEQAGAGDGNQCRVFEQADEQPDVGRDDGAEGLRQDDVDVGLERVQAASY
jgi:hypothetical protein